MTNRNIALSAALLLGFVFVVPQPASAIDFTRIVNRLTGYRDGYSGNQAQIRSNIDTGVSNLQAQIAQGVESGKLTAQERADLNSQLRRIERLDSTFMADGKYSGDEVNQILAEFNKVNATLSASLNNNFTGNAGYGGVYNRENFVAQEKRVRANINRAVRSRQISPFQGRALLDELNTISRQINGSNAASRRELMNQMTALDQRLQIAISRGLY